MERKKSLLPDFSLIYFPPADPQEGVKKKEKDTLTYGLGQGVAERRTRGRCKARDQRRNLLDHVRLVDPPRLDDVTDELAAPEILRGCPGEGDAGVSDVADAQRSLGPARLNHHTC